MSHIRHSFAQTKIFKNKAYIVLIGLGVLLLNVLSLKYAMPVFLSYYSFASASLANSLFFLVTVVIALKLSNNVSKQMDRKLDEFDKNWRNAELGDQGEKLVYKNLTKWLPSDRYTIYSNLTLPKLRSDLDFVIVGKKGIILVEVKNFKKTRNTYGKHKFFNNDLPSTVGYRATMLSNYLEQNGINDIHVRKVIVYVNKKSVSLRHFDGLKSHVYIAQGIEGLFNYLNHSWIDKKFSQTFCSEINKVLSQLDVSR